MATFRFWLIFFLLTGSASSPSISSHSFSDSDMFKYQRLSGRLITEEAAACPIDFEHKNYTSISTHCNRANFQPEKCCYAFKELTCPYWEILTDSKFNCASILFGSLVRYTNDTSDPISSLCNEGGTGLDCGAIVDTSSPTSPIKSCSGTQEKYYSMAILVSSLLQFLLHLY